MSTATDPANVGDEQQRITPRRVLLLVEEEPEILIILHRSLRDLTVGYDLVMTKTGSEALALFAVRDIRMVITAYNLPAMNGISLTTEIKNVAPTTPVVLITAYATPELEKRARAAGVDYFLPKPYLLDRLRQIVREVIRFDWISLLDSCDRQFGAAAAGRYLYDLPQIWFDYDGTKKRFVDPVGAARQIYERAGPVARQSWKGAVCIYTWDSQPNGLHVSCAVI